MLIYLIFTLSSVFAQSDSDKVKTCLAALYTDQAQFVKVTGHYAAHVDLLENSDKEACFGISLKLSRRTKGDYNIEGSKNNETWVVDHNKLIKQLGGQK